MSAVKLHSSCSNVDNSTVDLHELHNGKSTRSLCNDVNKSLNGTSTRSLHVIVMTMSTKLMQLLTTCMFNYRMAKFLI